MATYKSYCGTCGKMTKHQHSVGCIQCKPKKKIRKSKGNSHMEEGEYCVKCGDEIMHYHQECNGGPCTSELPKDVSVECAHCGWQSKIDKEVINFFCPICAGITVMG